MRIFVWILCLVALTTHLFAREDDLEVLCSKALLSEMKKNGLLSSPNGICLQSLNDLPQISIGLGSSVYSSGQSDGKSLGNQDQKVRDISQILTGKPFSEIPFSVIGYADGQNNTFPSYTNIFLKGKSTFSKSDIRENIKDHNTKARILELLKDIPEDQKIDPVWGEGNKTSFKHDPKVKYVQNIDRVTSLINNYYLSVERAAKTCEQLVGPEKTKSCEASTSGFASPTTEILSRGQIRCDARRKAVLILNPGPKAADKRDPSLVQPNFKIPDESESRRDMQIAAAIDLMKKIMDGGGESNARNTIEILATSCSNHQTGDGYQLNKQNLERMYEDIYKLNVKNPNPELKKAITNGDYNKVKKLLFSDDEKNEYEKKLAKVLTFGRDKDELELRLEIFDGGKKLYCNKKYIATGQQAVVSLNHFDHKVMDCEGRLVIKKFNPYNTSQILEVTEVAPNRFSYKMDNKETKNPVHSQNLKLKDSKYPLASRELTSTDVFNCLSASKAIEEKLLDSNQTGGGGQIIDPADLVPKDGFIKVAINSESIKKHKTRDNKDVQGWMCSKCSSGLHVNTNAKNEKTIGRKTREYVNTSASEESTKNAPIEKMGLTFGSMRNLGFRKVTRLSFSDKCPTSKSVCDCLRNVSNYGGLDKVLEKSLVVNLNKGLESDMSFSDHDQKNSCLYTPPVAPSCSVDPSGKGSENDTKGLESSSCIALKRFMVKFPNIKAAREKSYPELEAYLQTFKSVPLKSLLCKNVFPSEDDAKDCSENNSSAVHNTGARGSGE